jgi:hypothetical protein
MKILQILFLLLCISFSHASTYDKAAAENIRAFKDGYRTALMGMMKEFQIQGIDNEPISFDQYIVAIDATGVDDYGKIAMQQVGFVDYDAVRLANGWIVYGAFLNDANAKSFKKKLAMKLESFLTKNMQPFVYETKKDERFVRERSVYFKIARHIKEDLEKNTKIVYVTDPSVIEKQKVHLIYDGVTKEGDKFVSDSKKNDEPGNAIIDSSMRQGINVLKSRGEQATVSDPVAVEKKKEVKKEAPSNYVTQLNHDKNGLYLVSFLLKDKVALTYKLKNRGNVKKDYRFSEFASIGEMENTQYLSGKTVNVADGSTTIEMLKVYNKNIFFKKDDIIEVERIYDYQNKL